MARIVIEFVDEVELKDFMSFGEELDELVDKSSFKYAVCEVRVE